MLLCVSQPVAILPLSQGAAVFVGHGGRIATVRIPLFGVPSGKLLHEELRSLGYEALPEEEEPWLYTDDGVLIPCVTVGMP